MLKQTLITTAAIALLTMSASALAAQECRIKVIADQPTEAVEFDNVSFNVVNARGEQAGSALLASGEYIFIAVPCGTKYNVAATTAGKLKPQAESFAADVRNIVESADSGPTAIGTYYATNDIDFSGDISESTANVVFPQNFRPGH